MAERLNARLAGAATGILTLGLALTLGLSGCSLLTTISHKVNASIANQGKPRTGDCWASTFYNADHYVNWDNTPPVSCAGTHQLYTFAVPPLEYVHEGKLFDSKGHVASDVQDDVFKTCDDAETSYLPVLDYVVQRIALETFLPNERAWNAGARWVRCDVSVLAVGSPIAHPLFESLPTFAALKSSISTDPAQYDFCVTDPSGMAAGGPKGSGAVYADCSDNPQWMLKKFVIPPQDVGAPYPGQAALTSDYNKDCKSKYSNKTHTTYPYYPSKTDWADGNPVIECWIGVR